jgi:hypothetical protein
VIFITRLHAYKINYKHNSDIILVSVVALILNIVNLSNEPSAKDNGIVNRMTNTILSTGYQKLDINQLMKNYLSILCRTLSRKIKKPVLFPLPLVSID